MSEEQPRLSSAKVTLAVLGAIALLFVGCAQFSTQGWALNVSGSDELFGGACLIAGTAIAFWLCRIAFKSTPSFVLHSDRIEFHGKQPIHFHDVDEIVFRPAQIWLRQPAQFLVRMKDGSSRPLPYGLMTHSPEAFADLLNEALTRYRAEETN